MLFNADVTDIRMWEIVANLLNLHFSKLSVDLLKWSNPHFSNKVCLWEYWWRVEEMINLFCPENTKHASLCEMKHYRLIVVTPTQLSSYTPDHCPQWFQKPLFWGWFSGLQQVLYTPCELLHQMTMISMGMQNVSRLQASEALKKSLMPVRCLYSIKSFFDVYLPQYLKVSLSVFPSLTRNSISVRCSTFKSGVK